METEAVIDPTKPVEPRRRVAGGWLREPRLLGFSLFAVALTLTFLLPLVKLARHAYQNDLHSHILLIPLVSAYLIFLKRESLGRVFESSLGWGGLLILFGLVVTAAGWMSAGGSLSLTDRLAIQTLAYLLLLWGGAMLFLGGSWLRTIAFPAGFLIFMIPLPDAAVTGLEDLLVVASAEVSHWFFLASGTPVYRDGQVLQIPGIVLEVARECSGIRSTWVLIITSLIASYLFLETPWRRAVLIAMILPLGVLRNGFRILVIGLLCVHYGPHMIHSRLHREGGPLFFALSLIPLFLVAWWLRRREVRAAHLKSRSDTGTESAQDATV